MHLVTVFATAPTGDDRARAAALADRMAGECAGNILPFWLGLHDKAHGGHFALMDPAGRIDRDAPKSAVFVARLLWTLAAAGRATGDPACLIQAASAKAFLLDHLFDRRAGGLAWSVSRAGGRLEADKHVYAQAFGIYGLSAYAEATGDSQALAVAQTLFTTIETRARRARGYQEAFDQDWQPVDNHRLAPHGGAAALTANTHLHLIEAYTGLARVWPDSTARAALRDLVALFLDHFVADGGSHCHAALDADLQPLPGRISYGHDIESSWLIEAAGDVLGDDALSCRLRQVCATLAEHATEGQDADGGWSSDSVLRGRGTRVWWVQAEAMLGLLNAARRGGSRDMVLRAEATWAFIARVVVDPAGGWFAAVDRQGRPDPRHPKVGPWTDPYHQVRACLLAGTVGSRS